MAAPAHAQVPLARNHSKKARQGKVEGTLQSVTSSGDSVVVTLQGSPAITLDGKKLKVIDLRGKKRQKATVATLSAGMHVKVVTGPPSKIKILP